MYKSREFRNNIFRFTYWRILGGINEHYRQRFSPASPAPRSAGWELGPNGAAPVPEVRPSWERELRMRGVIYRQEGAAGGGGRPHFRGKRNPNRTVSWAAGEGGAGRWEWRSVTYVGFYTESAEQLPPRAVNRAAGPNTNPRQG